MKSTLWTFARWSAIAISAGLLLIQVKQVDRDNPPIRKELQVEASVSIPQGVRSILTSACMDCHSNATEWSWYTGIAPVSWIAAANVHDARAKLNFSEWGSYSASKQKDLLRRISEQVRFDKMPPSEYSYFNSEHKLSTNQRLIVINWANMMENLVDQH